MAEAEPLMRRALDIDEQAYGKEHPNVATDLNNLAQLLQATNRMAEAEPLIRRAVNILETFGEATGHEHPNLRAAIENYRKLLQAMKAQDHPADGNVDSWNARALRSMNPWSGTGRPALSRDRGPMGRS